MPKINQEEYEMLKGLDDKWKWVARNNLYGGTLEAHTSKPIRMLDSHWSNGDMTLEFWGGEHQLHFIQWEDSEPYNISELIEEYESEETEVKKNLEWLKEEVKNYIEPYDEEDWLSYKAGTTDVAELILGYINQVEQPELPVIPDYVAEHITYMKEEKTLVEVVHLSLEQIELGTGGVQPIDFWISRFGDKFSRAWLDGYTVEEKKYVVPLGELHALCKLTDDTVDIYKEDSDKLLLDDDFIFTEQEIKDYDERFWAFAKPIEELEE